MKGSTYLIVVFGILVAKALGFGRNIIFASAFGASELTDIYFQVFGIATFVYTGIGTALATLVIKNLNKAENKSSSAQKQYVSYFIGKISLIILAATAVMYVFAEPIVRMLLPGLDPAFYANRGRGREEVLPWSIIDMGVRTEHLWHEREQCYASALSPDCRHQCTGCGANSMLKGGRCDG